MNVPNARKLLITGSAILMVLAQPPLDLSFCAWFSLSPLLVYLWNTRSRGEAFRDGLWYGTVYYLGTTYWVFHSMRIYGGVPAPAAIAATVLLALYLGLFVGVFALAFRHLINKSSIPALVTAPVLWVTLDLLRNYALTGFPWAALGYSQHRFLPLLQISDLAGVYGVTFILVAVNGALADIMLHGRRRKAFPLFPAAPTIAGLFLLAFLLGIVTVYGKKRLAAFPPSGGDAPSIAIAQGNIDQGTKWSPTHRALIMEKYTVLTHNVLSLNPELLVWPETSVPFPFGINDPGEERLSREVADWSVPLLVGAVRVVTVPGQRQPARPPVANSAVLLGADGGRVDAYDKTHLVPFGEYVPGNLPLGRLVSAVGDFVPGRKQNVLRYGPFRLGIPICYEIIFPNLVRKFVANGANVIVTITNDAWFGRTSAPYQHFSAAIFRAIENRTPVVRAANTGISGFIDAAGRVQIHTALFTEATAVRPVNLRSGEPTFYTRFGDVFAYLCAVTSVLILLLREELKA